MLLGIEIVIKQIILFLKNPKIETIQYSMILVPSLSYISSPNKHNDQPGLSIDMKLLLGIRKTYETNKEILGEISVIHWKVNLAIL